MVLDQRQNFVTAKYLENKSTKLHQTIYYTFILTRSRLVLLLACNRVMAHDLCQFFLYMLNIYKVKIGLFLQIHITVVALD